MKNRKLKLNELSVKSFVTQSEDQLAKTIRGGQDQDRDYKQISGKPCSVVGSKKCGGLTWGTQCTTAPLPPFR